MPSSALLSRVASGAAPRRAIREVGIAAVVAAVGVATVAAAAIGNGNPAIVALPVLFAAGVWAVHALPLRWPVMALMLVLLGIDDFQNAHGAWHTPWAIVNQVLVDNIEKAVPAARGLKLSGMELIVAALLLLAARRRAAGASLDRRGQVETAAVLRDLALVYLAAVAFVVANGLARGGSKDVAIWQARPLLHLVLLVALFQTALRGPLDHVALGRLVIVAASMKAALALWVTSAVDANLATATSHGDSMLFVMACLVLFTHWMERPDARRIANALLFSPLLLLGMQANHRRLVWVELGFGLLCVYLVSSWNRSKCAITVAALVMAPVAVLYCVAGWNASGGFFRPVEIVRSVIDGQKDRSTYFRHVENWNLVIGMDERPVLGRGFGHEFIEYWHNDDISSIFPQYRAEPHNQVLGLLLFGGLLAFVGAWSLLAGGLFLAARSYRLARTPEDRAAALCCHATIVVGLVAAHGDLGPYLIQYRVLVALALVLAGKLAVASGAWPARQPVTTR